MNFHRLAADHPRGSRGWSATIAAVIAGLAVCMVLGGHMHAAESPGKASKEKARLTEMKRKAEKAAAELAETLRREKMSRNKVSELEGKLARQRRFIVNIDRKLSRLEGRMDKTEREVRALDDERGKVRGAISVATNEVFAAEREKSWLPVSAPADQRRKYFARRILEGELSHYGRLTADKDEKEKVLTGIERSIVDSERRMSEQKKLRERLATQQEEERRRLGDIEKRKKEKSKELKALKERIARMEALISRIERKAVERERKETRKAGPEKFSGVPGGLSPPLAGKVVARFGKQRDPVFDVMIENRGVEIEAASGAIIHAIGKGEVVFTGNVSEFGKVLIIQHGSGLFSVYGKAASFSVRQGQKVTEREAVGRLPDNSDGKSVLYLELRAGGTAVDPATVLSLSR